MRFPVKVKEDTLIDPTPKLLATLATVNGKPLIEVDTNFSLSENPVVRLQYDKAEATNDEDAVMTVYAADSKGNRYERSVGLGSNIGNDASSSKVGAKN